MAGAKWSSWQYRLPMLRTDVRSKSPGLLFAGTPNGPGPKSRLPCPTGGWSKAESGPHTARKRMNTIRVHLGPMPRMLRAMINDLLSAEPDITIVGNSYSARDSLPAASSDSADILIAQERAADSCACTAAVLSGAPAAILAVAANGRDGTSVNLVRRSISMNGGGLSLPDAVRTLLDPATCAAIQHYD